MAQRKRKTALSSKAKPVELAPDERYTVVSEADGRRVYFGEGVSKEDAENLAADLVYPGIVVRVVDL